MRYKVEFDVLFISEMWRGESEEVFLTAKHNKLFLSGGLRSKGVGIGLCRKWCWRHFFPCIFVSRVFIDDRRFAMISVYFPTSWESEKAVDETYGLLTLIFFLAICLGVRL